MTPKQAELLEFLRAYKATHFECPTFEQMKVATGLKSKSSIHRLLEGLAERGYVARLKHRARSVELLNGNDAAVVAARISGFDEGYMKGYRAGLFDRRAA